ncbi:phosphoribosylformylglycinamidine synthase [Savitreella phatthalungensis]
MEIFPGTSFAYSGFRVDGLVREINARLPVTHHLETLQGVYVHFVKLADGIQGLDDATRQTLGVLLAYDEPFTAADSQAVQLIQAIASQEPQPGLFYITPRVGTISPWSSKATNIAHVCELRSRVARIERGLAILLQPRNAGVNMSDVLHLVTPLLHDRMTENCSTAPPTYENLFGVSEPSTFSAVNLGAKGDKAVAKSNLQASNQELGLAIATDELDYLVGAFSDGTDELEARAPTDVELFMFAQVNSEHCRHKIFNASWTIDDQIRDKSLFSMIRHTHQTHPAHTISAYSDNAAVLEGRDSNHWTPRDGGKWSGERKLLHYLAKVETHNHPTAVSPFPGAATGSGGEIRDEGAVGIGSKPKAGLAGFSVSDLQLPSLPQPWELPYGKPGHIASPIDIMLDGPIGSAAFNNEFGRPNILGYFRTLSAQTDTVVRGFHKPIMLAGGVGTVLPEHSFKGKILPGSAIIVLGGPSMLVGLGGGAASSMASGDTSESLDFASVQRGNPEMERRAQMVIDACTSMGGDNPIESIHDVGAGGLSNALPELVHDAGLGAVFELRNVPCDDPGMSPMQIWCCEAQERYVLSIPQSRLSEFTRIAGRERCPFAVVGRATEEQRLILHDSKFDNNPIDLPMSVLFGKPPRMSRADKVVAQQTKPFDASLASYMPSTDDKARISEAVKRVLQMPAVGSKSFLITIGDRSVTGLVARDQMVGPWQVPVADVAVTYSALGGGEHGEAFAMGEKPLHALTSAGASARMCITEALLNLAAADIGALSHVRLSANWMADASTPGDGAALYEAVETIGLDVCPKLGVSIPVGKDSMSMKMKWKDNDVDKAVVAPLSLVITAYSTVESVHKTWTPQLQAGDGHVIVRVALNKLSIQRLGGSIVGQTFNDLRDICPDIDEVASLKSFMDAVEQLHANDRMVKAYHDVSEGGTLAALVEMIFAGRVGVDATLSADTTEAAVRELFNEEPAALFQIAEADLAAFSQAFVKAGLPAEQIKQIGRCTANPQAPLRVQTAGGEIVFESKRGPLQQLWARTSFEMQKLRDNPQCAEEEFAAMLDDTDHGLQYRCSPSPQKPLSIARKPRVAILREQGVNGHSEMAYSFHVAGFDAIDVHMTDLITGKLSLRDFSGLAACGGFSYGDVLGAGSGWAKSVLLHDRTRAEFRHFFAERDDTFALGVCNGCQFFSGLKQLIPGASSWPAFRRNRSEQYEARFCQLGISEDLADEDSVFLRGMAGWSMPVVVAHGEGRASFASNDDLDEVDQDQSPLRYLDPKGSPTERYPYNPNGSPRGIAGVTAADGRVLALMPHPERTILREASSWYPQTQAHEQGWGENGPWVQIFRNAMSWVLEKQQLK